MACYVRHESLLNKDHINTNDNENNQQDIVLTPSVKAINLRLHRTAFIYIILMGLMFIILIYVSFLDSDVLILLGLQ